MEPVDPVDEIIRVQMDADLEVWGYGARDEKCFVHMGEALGPVAFMGAEDDELERSLPRGGCSRSAQHGVR
jgi:hypothetical protein